MINITPDDKHYPRSSDFGVTLSNADPPHWWYRQLVGMRCSASPYAAIQAGRKEPQMIILGIVLIVVGLLVKSLAVLVTIGIILLVVGVILAILGGMGRPVGGRKHYY